MDVGICVVDMQICQDIHLRLELDWPTEDESLFELILAHGIELHRIPTRVLLSATYVFVAIVDDLDDQNASLLLCLEALLDLIRQLVHVDQGGVTVIRPAQILEDLHLHGHWRNIRIYLHLSLQLLVVLEDAINRADTANTLSNLSIAFTVDD